PRRSGVSTGVRFWFDPIKVRRIIYAWQRPKHNALDPGKDCGIDADPDAKRENDNSRQKWRSKDGPDSVRRVSNPVVQPVPPPHILRFFPCAERVAKLTATRFRGVLGGHSVAFESALSH